MPLGKSVMVLKNTRHERFAQELATGKSADEAYQAAGYKPGRAHASRLAANGNIRHRITELLNVAAANAEITLESLLREAAEVKSAAMAAKQYAAANGALKLKAELSGYYIQRKEDVTPRRSESEIDARLRELLAGADQAGSAEASGGASKPRDPSRLN
jgi:phage terminase small subunit